MLYNKLFTLWKYNIISISNIYNSFPIWNIIEFRREDWKSNMRINSIDSTYEKIVNFKSNIILENNIF